MLDLNVVRPKDTAKEELRSRAQDVARRVSEARKEFADNNYYCHLARDDPGLYTHLHDYILKYDSASKERNQLLIFHIGETLISLHELALQTCLRITIDLNSAPIMPKSILNGAHPGPPPTRRGYKWRHWYGLYLASDAWKTKRQRVLERAKGRCEGCGECDAQEVHHITYLHVGNEFLFQLLALCRGCHQRLHGKLSKGGK